MTKAFLKVTVVCATCAMLSMSSRAQSESQNGDQSTRSWSGKRLSATGRMDEPVVTGRTIIGAQVNDSSGNRCGLIQDIVVNPRSGRIEFALLTLTSNVGVTSTSGNDQIPVPWSLLRPTAPTQYDAGAPPLPVFAVNATVDKLQKAPTVSQTDLNESQWRQRVFAYYGVTPPANMGGAETDQGEIRGQGARELPQGNPEAPQPPATQ